MYSPISLCSFFSKLELIGPVLNCALKQAPVVQRGIGGWTDKNILTFNNATNLGKDSGNLLPTQRATTLTGGSQ